MTRRSALLAVLPSVAVPVKAGTAAVGHTGSGASVRTAVQALIKKGVVAASGAAAGVKVVPSADPPTSVPGLLYRVRPTTTGLSNGAAVGSLAAEVGGVTFTQGNAGARPTLVASGLGGRPALRFDGVDDAMTGVPTVSDTQPLSVVAVFRPDTPATVRNVFWAQGPVELLVQANGTAMLWTGGGATGPALSTTTANSVIAVANSPASTVYVNGTAGAAVDSGGAGLVSGGSWVLGNHISLSDRCWPGDLYEILVYDHALTAGDRAVLDSYVSSVYGGGGAAAAYPATYPATY